MYLISQDKKGLSAMALHRHLGISCNSGWAIGCLHDRIVCGGERASAVEPEFYWVNAILGNLKSALRSTYHAVRLKYAQRYLADVQYRFNRRFDLKEIIPRFFYDALRTPKWA